METSTPAEKNALRIRIEQLEKENALMKKLSSIDGFYKEYFIELRTAKFNKTAFDNVNERYFNLFGEYRYADWNSFRRAMNYYHNKK